jgi:hypothetical protein
MINIIKYAWLFDRIVWKLVASSAKTGRLGGTMEQATVAIRRFCGDMSAKNADIALPHPMIYSYTPPSRR